MRILISGWYGYGNTGDELILDQFLAYRSSDDITVLTTQKIQPERSKSVYHCDLLRLDIGGIKYWLKGSAFKLLKALVKTDCFVLGGGGIIREKGNLRNLRRILDEIHIASFLGKKIFIYCVSIGPIQSKQGEKMIASALLKCDHIVVRDNASVEYLRKFGIPENTFTMAADPVFCMKDSPHIRSFDNSLLQNYIIDEKRIPVFLTHSLTDEYSDFDSLLHIANALDRLHTEFGIKFVTIPFRTVEMGHGDDRLCAEILEYKMSNAEALAIYNEPVNAEDMARVVGESSHCVCVRLHSMILSIVKETPFVAINYDKKVRDTAIVADLSDWVVNIDESMGDEIYSLMCSLRAEGSDSHCRVRDAAKRLRINSVKTFEKLDEVLNS